MGENMKGAIDDLVSELNKQLQEVVETKRVINTLCRRLGQPAMFEDEETEVQAASGRTVKRDQFFGRPLVTVVRELMEMRGALTPDEIVKGLAEGDFHFEWKEDLRAKNLSISLSKNMQFIRLPSGAWGLRSKYPAAAKKQASEKRAGTKAARRVARRSLAKKATSKRSITKAQADQPAPPAGEKRKVVDVSSTNEKAQTA
jgi:hypothetical protein